MKVEGPFPLRATAPRRRSSAAAGGSPFVDALPAEPAPSAPMGGRPTTAIGAVDALFTIQEHDSAAGRRKRACARAAGLLDSLDDLRHALLLGVLPERELSDLARAIGERREAGTDPGLDEVLDEIDLRVQVELAKFAATP